MYFLNFCTVYMFSTSAAQVLSLSRLFLLASRPPQASEAQGRVFGGEEQEGQGQGGYDVGVVL